MENEKLDDAMQLSLELSEEDLDRSELLSFGRSEMGSRWQFIVKYFGEIKSFERIFPETKVVELLNGYGIITTNRENIQAIAAMPEIIYIEKPKKIYFNLQNGRNRSCLLGVQKLPNDSNTGETDGGEGLTGKGVLVGIIDTGECVIILSG